MIFKKKIVVHKGTHVQMIYAESLQILMIYKSIHELTISRNVG